MIDPKEADIGRMVFYTGNRYPGGRVEGGVITSCNVHAVFVRYGAENQSKATSRSDLEWVPIPPRKTGGRNMSHLDNGSQHAETLRETAKYLVTLAFLAFDEHDPRSLKLRAAARLVREVTTADNDDDDEEMISP